MERKQNSDSRPAEQAPATAPPPAEPGPAPAKGSGLFDKAGNELHPTHPDHGPMHLIPRQEDGRIATYYYCSKAELYDMQIPAPPPRRQRRDGFTPERQEQFLEYVRGGASGREAARRVGISPTTAYNLYNSPDGAAFRAGWDEAARVTDIVLEDTAFDRAVNGQEEIVFHKGQRVGTRWKYDNNLLMKLLRARNPLKYAPLSEIEGWLRHRGIAPRADVDGALDRLRDSEAEWGRRLPGEEETRARLAPPPAEGGEAPRVASGVEQSGADPDSRSAGGRASPDDDSNESGPIEPDCASPRIGQPEAAPDASTSSTSPRIEQPEAAADASTSSTSPGIGQEAARSGADPNGPAPDDGSIIYYRPPPRPRLLDDP
ncbi:MAG TPA: hypothetical protein VF688_08225 [Allosphingosinicella sp.]|jgi:hypothetical protein